MKYPVSVVLIVRNEEKNISDCLRTVAWCDDVIVIDQGSEDTTVKIAQKHGVRVISSDTRGICNPDRELGIRESKNQWVLILEADERVAVELKNEIISIISDYGNDNVAYSIPFRHYFLGKWIRSCIIMINLQPCDSE